MRDLIERAIAIIEVERDVLFKCHQIDGVAIVESAEDQVAVDAVAAMDAWLNDARKALSEMQGIALSDQTIPDDVWETARSLRNAVNWQSNASVEPIARALLAQRTKH